MKLLKFTAVFVALLIFVSSIMGMSYYVGYQTAKAKYIPQIDSLWESYNALAFNYSEMKNTADYWEWQAGRYKMGAEAWASDYTRDTQALKAEIDDLKEQLNTKPQEVVITPEDWDSLDELKAFLNNLPETGTTWFTCRPIAEELRDSAEAIGKRLETESLTRTEAILYFDMGQELKPWDRHEVCKALIGNEMWFVEPSTHKLFLAYYIPY